MRLRHEALGVHVNFLSDRHDGTAYIPRVGVKVKSIDSKANTMTETLIGTIGAALLGWIGASVAWAFGITSRVAVVEKQQQITSEWLERVEAKLDSAIAGHKRGRRRNGSGR